MKFTKERTATALCLGVQVLVVASLLLPEIAQAQVGGAAAFSGLTDFLRELITLLVRHWARLLAIGVVVWEAIRWKTGHASLMQFCIVIVACFVAAFAPDIVNTIWSKSTGTI